MIAFSCPHCNAQLQVKDSSAGKTGSCPGCSRPVQAPGAGGKSAVRAPGQSTLRPVTTGDTVALPGLAPPDEFPFLAPPQGPDELGRLGHYRVQRVLGTGAMGVVFQAEDLNLKRLVALKVMKPSLAASADFHRRFLREAQLSAAVDHEHVVTVYQVGEDRGVPFLAMKLLQGETLEDRLKKTGAGRLPPEEVLRVGREVAEGLAAAHDRGLVHRDIKPSNVWLESGGGRVKIVDFGLARGTGEDAHFTQAGAVIGTPAYMAPEQANGKEVDARCDLFSLGAVLYRACTGGSPFQGKDTLTVLSALANKTPEPPHKVAPAVPRALSDLIMWLLEKAPDDRPQSAREVADTIEAIERGEVAEDEVEVDDNALEVVDEAAPAPARARTEAAPAPAAKAEGGPSASGVKRKGPKKPRPSGVRKRKQSEAGRDWGFVVFVGALVLFVLALVVLILGVIRYANRGSAAAPDDNPEETTAALMSGVHFPGPGG
jgi:serine/threonine protein kinase